MEGNIFKALTFLGKYVDANMLEKGIYSCEKPYIYNRNETIETLIERGRNIKDITGNTMVSERYFENLSQCKLVEVSVNILS